MIINYNYKKSVLKSLIFKTEFLHKHIGQTVGKQSLHNCSASEESISQFTM